MIYQIKAVSLHNETKRSIMNSSLNKAKANKYDEFYTMEQDVIDEVSHYDLRGKVVYCNCDCEESAFVKYFVSNFKKLGLKLLLATCYNENGRGELVLYTGKRRCYKRLLEGNGDFRSDECVAFLKDADVVITNPPFSLFRDFVALMKKYNKEYLIIGLECAAIYKEYFKDIKNGTAFTGHKLVKGFMSPSGEIVKFGNICWWTNILCDDNVKSIPSKVRYSKEYIKLDNYQAILIDKVNEIPIDYEGVMAVPITYIKYHNPREYEIVGVTSSSQDNAGIFHNDGTSTAPYVNGKKKFARVLIIKKDVFAERYTA